MACRHRPAAPDRGAAKRDAADDSCKMLHVFMTPPEQRWLACSKRTEDADIERALDEPDRRDRGDGQRAAAEHDAAVESTSTRSAKASGRNSRDDRELPELDADVEAGQRQRERRRSAGRGRAARRRSRSRAAGRSRTRRSSGRSRPPANRLLSAASTTDSAIADSTQRDGSDDDAERRERQRDRVRERERGDDLRARRRTRRGTIGAGCHAPPRAHQHRGQQQRQQEQDVVEAESRCARRLRARRSANWRERPARCRRRRRACGVSALNTTLRLCAALDEVEQAAMLRIDVVEQPVVDVERRARPRAGAA